MENRKALVINTRLTQTAGKAETQSAMEVEAR
jgi:hypothetical protein